MASITVTMQPVQRIVPAAVFTPTTAPTVTISTPTPTPGVLYDLQAFQDWKREMFTTGEKITGRDAGLLWQESRTDDYIYKCTKAGEAGVAIWKKYILFRSE